MALQVPQEALHHSKSWHKYIQESLKILYAPEEAREIAFMLIHATMYVGKSEVLAAAPLPFKHLETCRLGLEKLLEGIPIQYVVGFTSFYNVLIDVNPHVFIPRQETEELVDRILQDLSHTPKARLLDMGTGSGCIPIALKYHMPEAEIYAFDLSEQAVATAKKSAEKNEVTVHFFVADMTLADTIPPMPPLDMLISNAPYVLPEEKPTLLKHVVDFEPHMALFAPQDEPLYFYEHALRFGKTALCKGGRVYFEFNETQGEPMVALMKKYGYSEIEILRDMHNKVRFAKAVLA